MAITINEMFFVVGGQGGWDVSSVSGMVLVTMVFGGIHCIAWSFAFPSTTEQLLWRISSIAITGIPLAFVGVELIRKQLDDEQPSQNHPRHHKYSTRLPLSHFPNSVAGVVPYDSAVSSSLGVSDGAMDDFSSSRLACMLVYSTIYQPFSRITSVLEFNSPTAPMTSYHPA